MVEAYRNRMNGWMLTRGPQAQADPDFNEAVNMLLVSLIIIEGAYRQIINVGHLTGAFASLQAQRAVKPKSSPAGIPPRWKNFLTIIFRLTAPSWALF